VQERVNPLSVVVVWVVDSSTSTFFIRIFASSQIGKIGQGARLQIPRSPLDIRDSQIDISLWI
jgi:hypothetical protein